MMHRSGVKITEILSGGAIGNNRLPLSLRLLLIVSCILVYIAISGLLHTAHGEGGDVLYQFGDAQIGMQRAEAMVVDSAGQVVITGYSDQLGTDDYYTVKLKDDGTSIEWSRRYDSDPGNPNADDHATALAIDSFDNVIVTGYAWNGTDWDLYTVKYRASDGVVLWQHTFSGDLNDRDYATAIAVDSINNVYVGGYTQGANGADDYLIVKYGPDGPNLDGTPIWARTYNGSADGHDRITAIVAGFDGIAVTGESQNSTPDFDMVTIKYGFDGALQFDKRYSASGDDKGVAVGMDSTGNVIAAGSIYNGSNFDIYTVKYDGSSGDIDTNWGGFGKTFDGGYDDEVAALFMDSFDNIYITGYTFVLSNDNDIFTARYEGSNGALAWSETFNSADGNKDFGIDVVVDNSGDVFVAGNTYDVSTGEYSFRTLKHTRSNGNLLWQKGFDGSANKDDMVAGVGITPSGEPIVAGWSDMYTGGVSDYDFYAIKYDPGLLNPPTDLVASTVSSSEILLEWSDNSLNEDEFRIERKVGESGTWGYIDSVGADTDSYNDTGLPPDTKYYYRVQASKTGVGGSHYSNEEYAVTTVFTFNTPAILYVYNAADDMDDYVTDIDAGPDNTPVSTGYSYSLLGQADYYTVKLDQTDLSLIWDARYDSDQNDLDMAQGIAVDSNNDVLVTGFSYLFSVQSGGNTNDIFSIKYPSTGPPESWNDQYNGPAGDDDRSSVVDVTRDGSDHYVVVGYGRNADWNDDIYVVKYLADGTRVWVATPYDGGVLGQDYPSAVKFDPSGDVIVTGYTENGTNYDYFTRKYDGSTGTPVWTDIYNGAGDGDDYARSVTVDADGDVYVTGSMVTASGNDDFYTIKYDGTSGARLWEKSFNGLANGMDEAIGVEIDPVNGDVVVAGTALTGVGNSEFHIIRYDRDGNKIWEMTTDRSGSNETAMAMAIDLSGNVHVTGETESGADTDAISVLFDYEGTFLGGMIYDGGVSGNDGTSTVVVNDLGDAFVGGYTFNDGNNADYLVYKIVNERIQAPIPFTAASFYTQVDLTWTDNSDMEDQYRVERLLGTSCDPEGSWTLLQVLPAGTEAYIDENLGIGEDYCYRLRAEDTVSGLASRWVYRQSSTTDPTAPSGLSATAVDTTTTDITWTDTTGYEDGFVLQRCSGVACDVYSDIDTLPPDAEEYTDTDLCEGGSYTYRIKAFRTDMWTTGYSNTDTAVTPSVADPNGLTASRISEARIDITWTDNVDDETGYTVEKCTGAAVDCTEDTDFTVNVNIGTTLLRYEMDESLWNGTADEVIDSTGRENHGRAYGNANTTSDSHSGRAGSFSGDSDYVHTGDVDIGSEWSIETWFKYPLPNTADWNTLTRGSTTDHQVIVQRSTFSLGTYVSGGFRSSGYDMSLLANGWHHLVVVGNAGETVFYIDGVQAGNAVPYQSTSDIRSVGNYWGGSQQFGTIDEFVVYDRSMTAAEAQDRYLNGNNKQFSYIDTDVIPSVTYSYRVRGFKNASCSWQTGYSNTDDALTTLLAPSDLTAVAKNTTRIDLSWTDNTASETGFEIERCLGAACDFTVTDMTDTVGTDVTTYSDTILCEGTTYTYRVRAVSTAPAWQSDWTIPYAEATTDTIVGAEPIRLSASAISESEIDLSWTSVTSDQTGFTIERCTTASGCTDAVELTHEPTPGAELLVEMEEAAWTGAAGEVQDSSGLENHGTAFGGATTVAEGKYGRAGSFDGSNDSVEMQYYIDQSSGTAGVTMEAWVYPTSTSSGRHQLISTDNGGYDWSLARNGVVWTVFNGTNEFNTGLSVDLNEWQHVAAVYTPGSGVTFYKNGYQVVSNGTLSYDASDNGVAIGRRAEGGEYFAGRVDDVAVYNRPLTSTEIEEHFELGIQAGSDKRYRDSGLNPGTEYQYRVKSYKSALCSWETGFSNPVTATPDTVPAPMDLMATVIDTTTVDLTWTDMTESESKFSIERCDGTLLLHYHMDEGAWDGTPDEVVDSSGSDNNGTASGSANTVAGGYSGRAGSFTGDADYVDTGVVDIGDPADEWSIEVWFMYPLPTTAAYNTLTAGSTGDRQIIVERTTMELGTYNAGDIGDEFKSSGYDVDDPVDGLSDGWHHLIAVGGSGETVFYIDGNYVGTSPFQSTSDISAVGNTQGGFEQFGTIDELTVYGPIIDPPTCTSVEVGSDITDYTDDTLCESLTYRYRVRAEKDDGPPNWISEWSVPADVTMDAKMAPEHLLTEIVSETVIELNWTDNVPDETGFKILWCNETVHGAGCEPSEALPDLDTTYAEQMVLHMDETSWGVVQDSSGNGYNGTAYGGATTIEYGKFGRAGSFDGSNDYIATPLNVNQTSSSSGVTMEAWVKPDTDAGGWRHVISTDDDSQIEWGIGQYNTTWRYFNGSGSIDTGFSVDVGQWQHLVAVFTPGTGVTFYKNGVAYSHGTIAYNTDDRNITIGRRARDSNWYFDGLIDEVGIYDRPLTFTEVQQLYEQGAQSLAEKRYTHTGLNANESYIYRVWAYKDAACPWESGYVDSDPSLTVPPAPSNLVAAKVDTTRIDLTWSEHTAGETGFILERCIGNETECGDTALFEELVTLPADAKSYSDLTVCESIEYTYRIKAYLEGGWETLYSNEASDTAYPKAAPSGLALTRVSEIQIDMVWNDNNADETGMRLERCAGSGCGGGDFSEIATFGPDVITFSDSGLLPDTSYSYRIMSYKIADCPWDSGYSGIATETTSIAEPSVLDAQAVNTTRIDLSWNDNTSSETAFRVLRCDGVCTPVYPDDLLATLDADVISYTDDSVCSASQHTYRLQALKESGLLNDGGGCFTRRAPLMITNFARDSVTEVVVPLDDNMNADFSDIRFYDQTADVELPYYFDATTSTASFMTLGNDDVYMYYGNASAMSASDAVKTFELYDPSNAGYSSGFTKDGANPVLNLGANGEFDDTHIYGVSVMKDGSTYKMWYSGHDGGNLRIGYATSPDGRAWTKYASNPVLDLGSLGAWDDVHVAYPVVLKEDGLYEMWYAGHDNFSWRIGYATSSDGITWTKYPSNPVMDLGPYNAWDDVHVIPNSVIKEGDTYKLWYSGYNGSYNQIGYATSEDGIEWTKFSSPVLGRGGNGAWDDYHVYLASVIRDSDGLYKMWYTGHSQQNARIGYASSGNGTSWSKYASNPVLNLGANGAFDDVHVYSPALIKDSDGFYKVWYAGHDGSNYRIGYADVRPQISAVPEPSVAIGAEEVSACYVFGNTWTTVYSNSDSATTPTPVDPILLTVESVTDTQTDLMWADNTSDETGFEIERCGDAGCELDPQEVLIIGHDETEYSDTDLIPESKYCYRVRAFKDATCSWLSGSSNESCDLTYPAAPSNLTASALGSMTIILNWDDNSGDEDGFELEVEIFNGEFVNILASSPGVTSYIDTIGIEPEKEYRYRVRAFRGEDRSPYSDIASVTTPAWDEGDSTCIP